MPGGPFTTLYGAAVEGETYHHAAIQLYAGDVQGGSQYSLGSTDPPGTGFDHFAAGTFLKDLFPDPIIISGRLVRLTSRRLRWENRSAGVVHFDGFLLALYRDKTIFQVVAMSPTPTDWQPGAVIGGRLCITANIVQS